MVANHLNRAPKLEKDIATDAAIHHGLSGNDRVKCLINSTNLYTSNPVALVGGGGLQRVGGVPVFCALDCRGGEPSVSFDTGART